MYSFVNNTSNDPAFVGENEQGGDDLGAPLLLGEDDSDGESRRMTRVLARDSSSYYHFSGSGGGGLVYRWVAMRCLADRLPWIFHSIVTNGKVAAVAVLGINVTLVALWVPFWLLGKVITEYGVYALTISTIFLVGRSIIRLIAFPGSSQKVMTDIEAEFAKYCVQMITTAAGCLIDLGDLLVQDPVPNNTLHQLPNMWRRTKGYRDRVLGVFLDVLLYIYNQDSTSSLALSVETQTTNNDTATTVANGYGPGLTRYGNNRFSGDIGHFNGLTVRGLCIVAVAVCLKPFPWMKSSN